MRNIRIFFSNFKISLLNEMAHRINFIMRFASDSTYFFVYFIFYTVIYSYVPNINGWGKFEILILMGTFHIIISLFLAFYFPNLLQIPNLVKSGSLDGILIKPIDSQFLLSTQITDFGSLVNVFLGIAIIIFSIFQLGIQITIPIMIFFIYYIFIGVYILYNVLFILLSTIFWVQDSSWSISFFMTFNSFADKPLNIYKGSIYRFLTFIFPIGLVANVPAGIVLRKEINYMGIWIIIAAFILRLASKYIWKRGIELYEGASI